MKRLLEVFTAAERAHSDLMEPYSIMLAQAEGADERIRIMRHGLARTIAQRYPLAQAREISAVAPDTQETLTL